MIDFYVIITSEWSEQGYLRITQDICNNASDN